MHVQERGIWNECVAEGGGGYGSESVGEVRGSEDECMCVRLCVCVFCC